ncbi:putative T7SS-secreted protein [Streptomyces collinus]|uniref:putative T7SS-secreted protein n=1 Tax=Streptomyces collinus TaxID=42684 RepID=UPI002943635D|nr:RHS repeat-associated core domain-containing protein [Streptomyces collinus]
MSFTAKFNSVAGSLKSGYDHVKRTTGHVIDEGAHGVGDALDWAGAHGAADKVDDWGDSTASKLGAHVDEQQLEETEDPKELIHGDPAKLRETAGHLRTFAQSFGAVASGMQKLDSSDFQGEAADTFREKFAAHQTKWRQAAEACGEAAAGLEDFAHTVEWAQAQAREAVAKYRGGKAASKTYQHQVKTYNDAVEAGEKDPGPRPSEQDPGDGAKQAAEEILAAARRQRTHLASEAAARVEAALQHAPSEPSALNQLKLDGADAWDAAKTEDMRFFGGFMRGLGDLNNLARNANPLDPYAITHPYEALQAKVELLGGAVHMATHPTQTGNQLWNSFLQDPGGVGGELLPQFLIPEAGAEGAAVDGVRVAEDGVKGAEEAAAGERGAAGAEEAATPRKLTDDAPDGAHSTPDGDRKAGGDPVDLATGRMFLPQTDVVLPGILPLVFSRRTESGCAVGRFLGPSWTSTVDERLQIDAVGVVHVTADGLLIPYPHPVPGAPTSPGTGRARTLLARDADGDYTVTDPDSGLTFHFTAPSGSEPGGDGEAWLSGITERNGHTITIDRGENGLPLALFDSAGHQVKLSVTEGLITALSLAGAGEGGADLPLMSYGYQDGDLTAVTKPSGATTTFVYDDRRRVTAWIDSNGSRYDYVYDDRDRVVAEGGEAGHVQITLAYTDPDPETGHHTTTLTTADGHATRHLFGPGCRLLAVTDPLGHTTRFTYDRRGNLLTRTDPLGLTTAFSYDEDGRVISATRPDGSELRTVRGPFGLPVEVVGPDGTRMVHEFDERGNRTSVTDQAGSTTRYSYDHAGRLTLVTDALGATTRVVCDAAGLPVEVTDPAGAVTRTERDALGRPVRITDPVGGVTRLEWHADGQLARSTGPDGATESWTYDGEGNLLAHTDASGGVSRFEYTHFDLPVSRTRPDGARYEFEHDAELRLTRVINPQGLTWTYEYDAAGDVVSETDFDGRTLTYRMDAAGQLAARVDALGGTISFERDQLGQVVRKDVDGRVTTYGYDRAGRLLEAAGPDSELRYQYDRRGLTKTELVDGRPIQYAYDALGRRTRRITPTGHVTSYAYAADGLPHRLTSGDHRIDFTHDATGRELTRVFSNAITMTSAWDEAGRLSAQHITTGARAVNSRAYSYRADGHLTSVADRLSGTRTFDLDQAGRVTAVHAPGWTERYAYDDAGNQTSASWPSRHPGREATGPRTYTGTTITRAGDVRFEYDALGRVTLRQRTRLSRKPDTWRYEWDTENRLTSVTTPDGTRWRYRYDPLGRRTAKQRLAADGESVVEEIRFTWDGLTLCEQTSHGPDQPNTIALTWDHRDVVPLAQTERILTADARQEEIDRRFFAIATDLVGTPTELIDESGDIAWRSRSTLWGTTAWARDSSTYTPLRFPGQYYDPETGLHYNCFRHYDPETGRYTSPDPLGLAPAPNPLGYVDNPYSACDPLGLMPKYTKEERAQKRIDKIVDGIIDRANNGEFKKRFDYHGYTRHAVSDERVIEILKNPDAVYHSTGTAGTFTFRQGGDIVVIDGPGNTQGQAITAYGPSGIKGGSGATALGGKPSDPGAPVTDEAIVNGRIPAKDGGFMPPAVRIR